MLFVTQCLYLLFYQGVLPVLTTLIKYLQREEPLIYHLFEAQEHFMNKLASRFIKPEVIQKIKNEEKSFEKLDWHSHQGKSEATF